MTNSNYLKLIHAELIKLNSESLYISKTEVFSSEYDQLLKSFKTFYNKVNIAYSFKTNYIPNFLNTVKAKGGYAEVVSVMELRLALEVGFIPQNIFFNGPFKHIEETKKYLKMGVLVNVDSYEEFKWISNFSEKEKINCRLGIRLNFNFYKNLSRFGISVNDNSIENIFKKTSTSKFLSLESIHFHYAPRELSIWKECTKELIKFLDKLKFYNIKSIKFISLGGGMYSRMDDYIKDQLPFQIPSFDDYSENSIKLLSEYLFSRWEKHLMPEILIEPGTALSSKALDFVVQVVSVKNINEHVYINTSGSKYNMNPSPNRINSPIETYNFDLDNSLKIKKGKIVGYTCIESDIIHDDFNGNLSVGDLIIFKEIGSYSVVMKPPFILPDVPIIEFDSKSNTFELIRGKQTFSDIFKNFTFFQK